jgi:hypothetical protein
MPTDEMLARLFDGESVGTDKVIPEPGMTETPAAFDFAATKTLEFNVAARRDDVKTQNVVGVFEGSDRVLKNEYVAIGSHYDHVGTGTPDKSGDTIYNGADDDGSGTVAMLALAEAFAKGKRPKRSILFVWHAGEEHGLWGSEYFANHPTVPLANIITQLNIDMIGRSRAPEDKNPMNANLSTANEIYVIGSKMMSTELGALSERINRKISTLPSTTNTTTRLTRTVSFSAATTTTMRRKASRLFSTSTAYTRIIIARPTPPTRLITRRWSASHVPSFLPLRNSPTGRAALSLTKSYRQNY